MGETRAPSRNEIFSASLKVLNAGKKHHGNATVGSLLDLEVRIFLAVARKSGLRVITSDLQQQQKTWNPAQDLFQIYTPGAIIT